MRKCVNVNVELKMYINSKQNEKIDKIAVLRKDMYLRQIYALTFLQENNLSYRDPKSITSSW